VTAAALSGLLVLALAGCTTPAPEPTPTPGFPSEEEAFAAAEETYRAYVDAENARRDDPSAPDPQVHLTGRALATDVESQQRFDELGVHLVGPSQVVSFAGLTTSSDRTRVTANVCVDSTGARLMDESGSDVTPADRDPMLGLVVSFKLVDDAFLITDSEVGDGDSC
jgi:hypothetical protein